MRGENHQVCRANKQLEETKAQSKWSGVVKSKLKIISGGQAFHPTLETELAAWFNSAEIADIMRKACELTNVI